MKNYKKLFYAMLVGGLVYVGCAPLTSAMLANYDMSHRSRPQSSNHRCFTLEEDVLIIQKVEEQEKEGMIYVDWEKIAKGFPDRTARQIKDRWYNYLSPNAKQMPLIYGWTQEEDQMLISKVQEYGKKWSKIAQFFHRRTPRVVKYRYSTLTNKKDKERKIFPPVPNSAVEQQDLFDFDCENFHYFPD